MHIACADLSSCMGISFPVLHSVNVLPFCLSTCIIWHLVGLTAISAFCREGTGSFHWGAREVCVLYQLLGETCRPWVSMPPIEADLSLALLYVSKVSIQCLTILCFPWWLWYQYVIRRTIWTLIYDCWHSDDLCYAPRTQSSSGIPTGTWCSVTLRLVTSARYSARHTLAFSFFELEVT